MTILTANLARPATRAHLEDSLEQHGPVYAGYRVPDTMHAVTRVAFEIFASTRDFFALHLVTGAHAYRILFEYACANVAKTSTTTG